jgi:hypothetical protein
MMRAILGSAIGGLVAGAVALVASAQGRSAPESAWPNTAQSNVPYAMTVADTQSFNSAATTSPTLVQCEPYQEAVLQRSLVANREVAQVTCVSRMAPQAGYAVAAPAAYYPQPAYAPDIVQRPVVRTAPRAQRVVYTQAREQVEPKRSWKKTALIIGGSTGAGAGVGALAGGKKGALIGAAIGGGAATVYEVIKRK